MMNLNPDLLTAYEAAGGKELWKMRVGSAASSSPVAYDGLAFLVLENGETIVIDPKSEEHVVARNKLSAEKGELFRASLTPSDGQVFIRSDRTLYCIGKRKSGQ